MQVQSGRERTLSANSGRLIARPGGERTESSLAPGLHPLGLDGERDALLYVPGGVTPETTVPLVVMLHGAGGEAEHGINALCSLSEEKRFLLLAPSSRGRSWDIIVRERYGPDIAFLDSALDTVFARFTVDPAHIAIAGFSDGASYALSLGVMNGNLFGHVVAFAPGFMAPRHALGAPRFYVAHGTEDQVLPIDRCSRRIVPQLENAGYTVCYKEFHGPHTIPPEIAREAADWFLGAEE